MSESSNYYEQRVQAARAAAMNIRLNIDQLQLFCLQPSNKVGEKNKALEATMRIRRLASAVLAMSDRLVNDQIAVDPELMLDMMQAVIDGRTDGIRRVDLDKIALRAHDMALSLGVNKGQEAA